MPLGRLAGEHRVGHDFDFIFAAIGEELGLFGATAVLAAFVFIIGSGLRTAIRTDNAFEKLLAVGLTTILGVQAFIILAGVLRVLPLTGVTLPTAVGGGGRPYATYATALESVSAASATVAVILSVTNSLVAEPVF